MRPQRLAKEAQQQDLFQTMAPENPPGGLEGTVRRERTECPLAKIQTTLRKSFFP